MLQSTDVADVACELLPGLGATRPPTTDKYLLLDVIQNVQKTLPFVPATTSPTAVPPAASRTAQANRQYRKYELPDRLTPELVRGLLEDIRTDAVKRKLIRVG